MEKATPNARGGGPTLDRSRLNAIAERLYGIPPHRFQLYSSPLAGGLCGSTWRITARFLDPYHRPRTGAFVVKVNQGASVRESEAYSNLLRGHDGRYSPHLLHHERAWDQTAYLYLEWIHPWRAWPWQDTRYAMLVLERLALAHASLQPGESDRVLGDWDYESAVAQSAADTRDFFELCIRQDAFRGFARFAPAVRRTVAALGRVRRQLLADSVVVHGDVHPGNVLLRMQRRRVEPVFLDWARVRLGSPLEDVSSWLQSLGYWEVDARRRHDTLLKRYLEARGVPSTLSASVRENYWLAGASNALAGAMKYHLAQAVSAGNPEWRQIQAGEQVHHWVRLIARADACWRN